MSWIGGEIVIHDSTAKEIGRAREIIRSAVRHNADLEEFPDKGNYIMPIVKIFKNKIFLSYEDAVEACEKCREEWGRKYNIMVAFHDNTAVKPNKKMEDIMKRIDETTSKKIEYMKKNDVSTFKADYIGCPGCGSKINKKYIQYSKCPLCGKDLHSKTTKETLKRYNDKISELKKKMKEESKKRKLPVHYLIMYEEHVG